MIGARLEAKPVKGLAEADQAHDHPKGAFQHGRPGKDHTPRYVGENPHGQGPLETQAQDQQRQSRQHCNLADLPDGGNSLLHGSLDVATFKNGLEVGGGPDEITRRRMDKGEWDHWLDLKIRGVCIGDTGRVRWRLTPDGDDDHEYDEQYVADVLEKVIQVIRNNDADA